MDRVRSAASLIFVTLMAGCSHDAGPTTPTATNRPCPTAVSLVGPPGLPGVVSLACSVTCTLLFPLTGGQETAFVQSEPACAWTAVSDQGWITVAPTTGTGPGSVRISAPANASARRDGHVTIGAITINVGQTGAP